MTSPVYDDDIQSDGDSDISSVTTIEDTNHINYIIREQLIIRSIRP